MKRNRFIFAMIVFVALALILLFLLLTSQPASAQTPPTCELPYYVAEPLGSMMAWAYQGLDSEAEPESFKAATEWLAHSPDSQRAGPYMGNVLLRVIELANSWEPSEWEAIGVSVGCAPGGIYQEYCD